MMGLKCGNSYSKLKISIIIFYTFVRGLEGIASIICSCGFEHPVCTCYKPGFTYMKIVQKSD